ncbi:BamA/TamA family outer membrane protein [Hymenobacter sp. ASUV-10]|uniref:BamA/TamA family outer membrane protein n=1 Tax=Hymenobacter aranciens TaxID=3063996 RepID=A0ABT9B9F8_9BACT|nr:BamA/TamA family outer membrane protein [Hymenobacter sp. ASUV-10]MDO7874435.1 BamA/TamA family outer membrane protein [Hymenobacter sp. ASUV-10]
MLSACSGLKFIPEGEKLYTGSKVTINAPEKLKDESALQTELESVVRPKPNGSLLGMRPKLYFWHMGVGKTKGLGKKLADQFGEAPVLLSQVEVKATEDLISNRQHNNGYFQGKTTAEVKAKDKTAEVNYTATPGRVYTWSEVNFPSRDTLIDKAIRATQGESLLKVGEAYNLGKLTNERVRIDAVLKNQGYYYFAPDYLLFQVDSTLGHKATVDLRVKPTAPAKALQPYWLNEIKLNTDYVLADTSMVTPIRYKGYQYYPDEKVFKAKAITNAVFMYPDSLFRRRRRDQTLSRLMSLGTFKFVEIRFRPSVEGDTAVITPGAGGAAGRLGVRPRLDADILMTQYKKKSLRAEVQLATKTNGFTGPAFNVSFRNRSALRGAEQLIVNATAAFETQTRASGSAVGLTSYELGVNAQLLIPRLIAPAFLNPRLPNSDFQPRTSIGAGYKNITRTDFFRQDLFSLNYGYVFKTKITNEQEFRPIDIQYVRLADSTREFSRLLDSRKYLANAFRQQFILGSSYRYTYNQQVLEQRRQQIYFSGAVEVSGNVANALASSLNFAKSDSGRYTIAGQEFSQYAKFDLEFREYYRLSQDPSKGNRFVGRLLVGVGLPYGNSRGAGMPYLKQYGIGGPNSVRAYAARQIGPGTYRPTPGTDNLTSFYDQVGDMRIEGNVEYRQDLFPYVKGALFLDAGNIWLINDDPERPGGKFSPSTFLNQLAVGAGAGIRIDVQFFVIRFDYAVPLRAPYGTPEGEDKAGRLNLAIGYPF